MICDHADMWSLTTNIHSAIACNPLKIINAILNLNHFPDVWKHAMIVFILKLSKNHRLQQNYRPISFLFSLSKVAKTVRDELVNFNPLPEEQFIYQAGLSTDFQFFRLTEAIRDSLERRETTVTVFLNFEKAFGTVWHDGILFKMAKWTPVWSAWFAVWSVLFGTIRETHSSEFPLVSRRVFSWAWSYS